MIGAEKKEGDIEMDSLEMRRKQLDEALKEARDIARRKDLSDEERVDLLSRVDQIETLRNKVSEDEIIQKALVDTGSTDPTSPDHEVVLQSQGRNLSVGAAFVRSEQYAEWRAKGFDSRLTSFEYRTKSEDEYRTKSEPTEIAASALTGYFTPQRVGTIEPLPSPRISTLALIPEIPTGANAVSYFLESTETGGPEPVAEGQEKPNFTLTGALVTEEVEAVAGMAAVTRQTLDDAPFMAGFVDTRLRRALEVEKEYQVLAGDGTSPNLSGFLDRSTSHQVHGADTLIDAIYKAADKCYEDGGYPADAVVLTPANWQPIALGKDDVNRYYGDGPFGKVLGDTIWGLRVVKTRQAALATTLLVGAYAEASFVAVRDGVTIRTSDSHSDYFKKNKIAVLIEQRMALGVPAPLAFCTLSTGSS